MAVLGFDHLALMLFYSGRGGFETFHIDNVVSTVPDAKMAFQPPQHSQGLDNGYGEVDNVFLLASRD